MDYLIGGSIVTGISLIGIDIKNSEIIVAYQIPQEGSCHFGAKRSVRIISTGMGNDRYNRNALLGEVVKDSRIIRFVAVQNRFQLCGTQFPCTAIKLDVIARICTDSTKIGVYASFLAIVKVLRCGGRRRSSRQIDFTYVSCQRALSQVIQVG